MCEDLGFGPGALSISMIQDQRSDAGSGDRTHLQRERERRSRYLFE